MNSYACLYLIGCSYKFLFYHLSKNVDDLKLQDSRSVVGKNIDKIKKYFLNHVCIHCTYT